MRIGDLSRSIHNDHCWCAKSKEVLHLEILPGNFGTFVREDRVRGGVTIKIAIDHEGSIGHHHEYFSIQRFKIFIVMAQLRHMVFTVWSGKADVKDQDDIFVFEEVRKTD